MMYASEVAELVSIGATYFESKLIPNKLIHEAVFSRSIVLNRAQIRMNNEDSRIFHRIVATI